MEITFLIGNGFDIQAGLGTTYANFYAYLTEKAKKDDSLKENMIYKEISHEVQNHSSLDEAKLLWTDLETGLGRFTIDQEKINIENYAEAKEEIESHLRSFLKNKQDNDFVSEAHTEKIDSIFKNSLSNFVEVLATKRKQELLAPMTFSAGESVAVNILDFNFTNIFQKHYNGISSYSLGTKLRNKGNIKLVNKDYLKVHGGVDSEYMNVGVNDLTQLNPNFEDHVDLPFFIKSKASDYEGELHYEKGTAMLNRSSIYIAFGLSMGQSDKRWWQLLLNKLKEREHKALIYCMYTKDKTNLRSLRSNRIIEGEKERLFSLYAPSWSEREKEKVKKRIFIVLNKELFNINIAKLNELPEIERLNF